MRKAAWLVLAGVLLLAVLAAMGLAAFLVWGLPQEIGRVTVNGEVLNLRGAHAGHWLLVTLVVLLVLTIALVVVPTIALLALMIPIILVPLGLVVGAVAVGLLLSPLILLIWWLWKRKDKAGTIAP